MEDPSPRWCARRPSRLPWCPVTTSRLVDPCAIPPWQPEAHEQDGVAGRVGHGFVDRSAATWLHGDSRDADADPRHVLGQLDPTPEAVAQELVRRYRRGDLLIER